MNQGYVKIQNLSFGLLMSLTISACGIKTVTTTQGGNNPSPSPSTTTEIPLITKIEFLKEPVEEAVKTVSFSDDVEITFYKDLEVKKPPSNSYYSIKAYSDSNCSNLSSGTLSYTASVFSNVLRLTSIKYNKAEDLYIGVSGNFSGNIVSACSKKIQVLSSSPASLTVLNSDGAIGMAGMTSEQPVLFQVTDASNLPVKNARIKINDIISPPSSDSGEISWKIPLSTDISENTTRAFLFSLIDGDIDYQDFNVVIYSNVAKTIHIDNQGDPTNVVVNEPSDPISLMAKDIYGNPVAPNLWDLSVQAYLDPSCSTAAPPAFFEHVLSDLGVDPQNPSTFLKFYIYSFDYVGTVYFKFSLLDQNGTVDNICSNPVNIISL